MSQYGQEQIQLNRVCYFHFLRCLLPKDLPFWNLFNVRGKIISDVWNI